MDKNENMVQLKETKHQCKMQLPVKLGAISKTVSVTHHTKTYSGFLRLSQRNVEQ